MEQKERKAMSTEVTWPCACVKRDRKGNMTHIKLHSEKSRSCKKCGAKRPDEWVKAQKATTRKDTP